jgi:hypothetical protein
MEPRWACIRTKPRAEFWARDNLYRVGHEVFLPMTAVRRRDRSGRYEMAEIPLFTSYMFLVWISQTRAGPVGKNCPPSGILMVRSIGFGGCQMRFAADAHGSPLLPVMRVPDGACQHANEHRLVFSVPPASQAELKTRWR